MFHLESCKIEYRFHFYFGVWSKRISDECPFQTVLCFILIKLSVCGSCIYLTLVKRHGRTNYCCWPCSFHGWGNTASRTQLTIKFRFAQCWAGIFHIDQNIFWWMSKISKWSSCFLAQVNQPMSICLFLGFETDPSQNIAARIRGPNVCFH